MTTDRGSLSSSTHPLQLYEILSAVLSFLDRPSLLQASLVCTSWHACSQPILQQTCAILTQDFLGFFSPPGKFDVSASTRLHAAKFVSTCHRTRSLRVGSILKRLDSLGCPFDRNSVPHLPKERMAYLFQLYRAYQVHPGLKNLVHLDIHFHKDSHSWGDDSRVEDFYAIMYGLILDNNHLRDLEFTHIGDDSIATLYDRLCDLKVAHPSSVDSADGQQQGAGTEPWTLQELVLHSVRTSGRGRLTIHAKTACSKGYPELRSLTMLDFTLYRRAPRDHELYEDTDTDTEFEHTNPNAPPAFLDPKLYLIQQYPNLERLRISYDLALASQPARKSFSERVLYMVPDIEESSHWMQAPEDFVQEMYKACPKLKSIDLGGNVDLSGTQWEDLIGAYGRQLESLVVWGVLNFTGEAFVRLLEPHPSSAIAAASPGTLWMTSRLTELDISWAGGVETCAWLVFSNLPCLKHFKAHQVPLDAARLVGYDWACKDLETLTIQVLVPMQQWPLEPLWIGDRVVERWQPKKSHSDDAQIALCETNQIPDTSDSPGSKLDDSSGYGDDDGIHDDDGDDDEDDGYAEKFASKRIRVQESDKERKKAKKSKKEHKQSAEGKGKKARKHSMEGKDKKKARKEKKERRKSKEGKMSKKSSHCQQSDADSGSDSDQDVDSVTKKSQSSDTASHKASKASEPSKPYHIQVQVDLCEQLGRLHRLRELTLEGQRDCRYDDREWDCMHLTLKTGLDRLEGLQNSLEKLDLYQLQEELAGDAEVEWIAQNWIHHLNPAWQQDYRRRRLFPDIADDGEEDVEDDLWRPEPKFKELLGIGVRNTSSYSSALRAHSNLDWLKQECPRLRIEKDHRIQDDDYYLGTYREY
ncbi:hypothetical protein BGZ72_001551 [Mortierella alpina]|nr:hypothetical protein BGZ72_001551 [Mortierella alpina]